MKPLSVATHDKAVAIAQRFGIAVYDATIAARAIEAGCRTLCSEGFQHGQRLEQPTIVNPFRP